MDVHGFQVYRSQMNELFSSVNHTREQLQDAEVLKTLSRKVSADSNKMAQSQSKYDFDAFVQVSCCYRV